MNNLSCFRFKNQPYQTLQKQIYLMQQSRTTQHEHSPHLPKKQQWSIIYNHRANEYEHAKSVQKLLQKQKKDNFKRMLDQQIQGKNNQGQMNRDEDRKYYDFICKKDQEGKERQEREKFQRYIRQKKLEEDNLKAYEMSQFMNKNRLKPTYSNIQIGLKSQQQKKLRAQSIRKDVIQTLDRQRYQKEFSQRKKHEDELLQLSKNLQYQQKYYTNRNPSKRYQQNQNVYNYYRDIFKQKIKRDQELEHKFIDEVLQKNIEKQIKKKEIQEIEKERKNIEMKSTLQKQIELINYRRREDNKTNPQQATYSFISNIFTQKRPSYNKKQYSMFLDRQAQQQKNNKLSLRYMNQEQYKLNSNQLNKAVSGNYTFDKYVDRSMVSVGDRINLMSSDPIRGEDADLVKMRLEEYRTKKEQKNATGSQRKGSSLGNLSFSG